MTEKGLKFPVKINLYNIASADVISFIVEMGKNNIPIEEHHWKLLPKFKEAPKETINFILGNSANPTPSLIRGKTEKNQELTEITRLIGEKRNQLSTLNLEFEEKTKKLEELRILNLELQPKINRKKKLDFQITEQEQKLENAQKNYRTLIRRLSELFFGNRQKLTETATNIYKSDDDDEEPSDPRFLSLEELREEEQ